MPRTKIPKNSKRNREVANREEKVRIYELKLDSVQMTLDDLEQKYLALVDHELNIVESRLQTEVRDMKMGDFLHFLEEVDHFEDFKASDQTQMIASQSMCNNTQNDASGVAGLTTQVIGSASRYDEGYLTEDSSLGTAGSSTNTLNAYTGAMLASARAMRTPGPLHSAQVRRARRSRSACGEVNILHSAKPQASDRSSRTKMRTPMASRQKAFSADRTPLRLQKTRNSSPATPPMAFLRWPKPGEVALSKFGSPIVAQVLPDKFANVNIPIRNGVLSLRPKKLAEVKMDLLESLDADTLHQIKTLNENLQLIVHTANKAGLK